MSASRENLARAVRESAAQIEEMARALDGEALAGGVYENGWNARQLLCHLANGGWFAGFMIGLARAGRSLEPPADFDQDEWNARDVPAHQDKTIEELLAQLRTGTEQSLATIEATPDEVLAQQAEVSWGAGKTLADAITGAIEDHVSTHLAELRSALREGGTTAGQG